MATIEWACRAPGRGSPMVLALVLAGTLLAGCHRSDPSQPAFKAIDITGAEYARGFDLPDADGLRRHLADFGGKVVVVFFGYTHCPDVCPTTLAELAAVKQALGADGAQVQGIFVTIDPARDTPELLKNYVSAFSPDFIALRGTPEETRATARSFKVYYAQVPGRTEASYTMDHTAGSYIFDRHGAVRLFTRYGSGVEALTHDLRLLLAQP